MKVGSIYGFPLKKRMRADAVARHSDDAESDRAERKQSLSVIPDFDTTELCSSSEKSGDRSVEAVRDVKKPADSLDKKQGK